MRYALYPYCYSGEACLAPTKPCGSKAIEAILLPLQGAHELHILRLFIPKHHCRLLRARRASPLQSLAEARLCGARSGPACDILYAFEGAVFTEYAYAFARAVVVGIALYSYQHICL